LGRPTLRREAHVRHGGQTNINERQTRKLAKVPKETLRKATDAAKSSGRAVTANDIKEAISRCGHIPAVVAAFTPRLKRVFNWGGVVAID